MAGRHAGNGRATAVTRTGAPSGASEIGFAEIPQALSAPFATLPPEVIYRREKERRAMTGADAISSAMEEARREFAAMLAADRPKGTGGRPAKNGRGRPAAATQVVVADELDHEGESHEVEALTLGGAVEVDEAEPEVEVEAADAEAPDEVEVETRPEPATRRAGTKRAAKAPARAAAAPVRGKAAATTASRASTSAPAARRRKPARPAAAPARSRREKATASSAGGRRGGGSSSRSSGGARSSKR